MARRPARQRLVLAVLLAATATLITLGFRANPTGPVRKLQSLTLSIVAPMQDGLASVTRPIGNFFSAIASAPRLKKENDVLRARIEELELETSRAPESTRELARLLELNGLTDWAQGPKVGARVIGLAPSNHEWSAFLDRGTADGIKQDMTVISAGGLLGRIVEVHKRYSIVLLAVDPQHSVGVRLVSSGETGVATGKDGKSLLFELIDPSTPVVKDETVVTSGYDRGIYPPGIPVGKIETVSTARDGLTQFASISPFVDFTSLDIVLILTSTGPKTST